MSTKKDIGTMKTISFTIILLHIPVFLFAQIDTAQTYDLDPITITATRAEVIRSMVSPSISVISREAIEHNQQKSVFSLISQQVPGVFVQESGVRFGIQHQGAQVFTRDIIHDEIIYLAN